MELMDDVLLGYNTFVMPENNTASVQRSALRGRDLAGNISTGFTSTIIGSIVYWRF